MFRSLVLIGSVAIMPSISHSSRQSVSDDAASTLVNRAKIAMEVGKQEEAVLLLRRALRLVVVCPGGKESTARLKVIGSLLHKADPLASRRKRADTKIARAQIGLAKRYLEAGWYRVARRILEDNQVAAPRLFTGPLRQVKARIQAAEPRFKDGLTRFFKGGEEIGKTRGWRFSGNEGASPVPDGTTMLICSKSILPDRVRIGVEVKLGDREGSMGLAFGYKGQLQNFMVNLIHPSKGNPYATLMDSYQEEDKKQMKDVALWPGKYCKGDWVPIEVEVRGKVISVRVAQADPFRCTVENRDLSGRIALYVYPDLVGGAPVLFRDLKVEVLK